MLDRISSSEQLSAERKPLQLALTGPAFAIASSGGRAPALAADSPPLQVSASMTDASPSCATELDEPSLSRTKSQTTLQPAVPSPKSASVMPCRAALQPAEPLQKAASDVPGMPSQAAPQPAKGKKRSPSEAAQAMLAAMSNRKVAKAEAKAAATKEAQASAKPKASEASKASTASKASSADAGPKASADVKPEGRL